MLSFGVRWDDGVCCRAVAADVGVVLGTGFARSAGTLRVPTGRNVTAVLALLDDGVGSGVSCTRFAGVLVSALPKHCCLFLGLFFSVLTHWSANERCASEDSPTCGRPRFRQ